MTLVAFSVSEYNRLTVRLQDVPKRPTNNVFIGPICATFTVKGDFDLRTKLADHLELSKIIVGVDFAIFPSQAALPRP